MKPDCFGSQSRAWLCLSLAVLCAGCGGSTSAKFERYVPEVNTAQSALEAVLSAWQQGQAVGRIESVTPPIQVVDSHRKSGQKLARFEVTGEVPGEGPRCFAVKLHLQQPDEEQRARYVVVGVDPLWVFREEDYAMVAHWECDTPGESHH